MYGHLLEAFVVAELRKQATWNETWTRLYHFRTAAGREVDIVLENMRGEVVGVEVKSAASVHGSDYSGLEALAEMAGKKFLRSIVFYTGETTVPFGRRFTALPVSALRRMT